MKTYSQPGETVSVLAPYAVASGAGFMIASLFAVASNAAANGAAVEGVRRGVFTLTALSTDTATVGTKLYWDDTNKRLTTTVGSNLLVGCALAAKLNGDLTATVLLDGTIR